MSYSRNDTVLLPIPFTDLTSRKVRPAVIIGSCASDLFLVPLTSQLHNTDFLLREWRECGLNIACGVKAQIATVEARLVIKTIGRLTTVDEEVLTTRLRHWLGLP